MEARDRSGDAHGEVPLVMTLLVVLPVFQEQPCVSECRRDLAEVVGDGISVGGTVEKKAAPAEIARGGEGHGEREGRRDGRVNRTAAIHQCRDADLRTDELRRGHHPVLDANRMRGGSGDHGEADRERDHDRRS